MSIVGCPKNWTPDHALAAGDGPSVAEQIEAERKRYAVDPANPDCVEVAPDWQASPETNVSSAGDQAPDGAA